MKILKWLGISVGVILVLALAGYGFASYQAHGKLSGTYHSHEVDFPVPWPLSDEEISELRAELGEEDDGESLDLTAIARERAIERGRHLMTARYPCADCHGADFGGGVMVDDPAIGGLFGPNLTRGEGSVVADYTIKDWDRIVRHGITRRGTATPMPSVDFLRMSDQELSDIIAYIGSLPPVDRQMPPVTLGPLGKVLLATGQIPLTADMVDHQAPHPPVPPQAEATRAFGEHLVQVCVGCHGATLTGGPIAGGPPNWPPATNLTPHETGLGGWSFEDFERVMREGTRRDGSKVKEPMSEVVHFGQKMTDTELQAMYRFLTSLKPAAASK